MGRFRLFIAALLWVPLLLISTASSPALAISAVPPTTAAPAPTTTTTSPVVSGTYNVLDYGARADGVVDDAPAVQAAVNAARDAGGGVVYMPAGTYRFYAARGIDPDLGANIELFDNVTIKGAGSDKTFVVATRDWASAFGAIRKKNISVQDMDISADGSTQDGVKFGVSTDALVQNVVVHDINIGVAFYSCVNPVARNITAYNTGTGVAIAEGRTWPEHTVGGVIEDSVGLGGNDYTFRLAGKIEGDNIRRIGGQTMRRSSSGADSFLLTYAENLTLEDLTYTGTLYTGIHISGVNGAVLTNSLPAFVSTAENDPGMFATYGPSSNIVVNFADVVPSDPHYPQINAVAALGIVNGYGDGTFGPSDLVTRQQFAKMIVKTLALPVSVNDVSHFTDVASGLDPNDPLYPSHYAAVCAANGITLGRTATTFAPYDNLTRAQLITMVARSAKLPEPPAGYAPTFGDFSRDHYPWARKAAYAGLLDGLRGIGGSYDFWASATRGEVCVLLYNLLER